MHVLLLYVVFALASPSAPRCLPQPMATESRSATKRFIEPGAADVRGVPSYPVSIVIRHSPAVSSAEVSVAAVTSRLRAALHSSLRSPRRRVVVVAPGPKQPGARRAARGSRVSR